MIASTKPVYNKISGVSYIIEYNIKIFCQLLTLLAVDVLVLLIVCEQTVLISPLTPVILPNCEYFVFVLVLSLGFLFI